MTFTIWFLVAGALLIVTALANTRVKRLALSTSLLYLAVGVGLGPHGLGLIRLDPVERSALLERLSEIAVIISLFTAGLKLSLPLSDRRWRVPLRLAFGSMVLTVGMIALAGIFGMGLPVGAAILLGAVLAPTDPVLASDVQLESAKDRDRLRFSLTSEAGLNDGTAFPFVMLGLGLLGLHEIGEGGWRWVAVDVVWAIVGGLGVGALLGAGIGRLVVYLRSRHAEAVGLDDFLALGLIALSYGAALLIHTYGFLAVFAAGLALRWIERSSGNHSEPPDEVELAAGAEEKHQIATDPEKAPAYMAQAVLGFNEQIERLAEVTLVVIIGGMLWLGDLSLTELWFIPLLLLVIRPLAVWAGLLGTRTTVQQRQLMCWFGIRGIGSLYYLMYAVEHGLPRDLAETLSNLVLVTVAVSICVHGITVTPLMDRYTRRARDPQQQ